MVERHDGAGDFASPEKGTFDFKIQHLEVNDMTAGVNSLKSITRFKKQHLEHEFKRQRLEVNSMTSKVNTVKSTT